MNLKQSCVNFFAMHYKKSINAQQSLLLKMGSYNLVAHLSQNDQYWMVLFKYSTQINVWQLEEILFYSSLTKKNTTYKI
jgi:hypothetical protein